MPMSETLPDFDDMDGAETSTDDEQLEAVGLDDMLDDGEMVRGIVAEIRTDVGKYDSTIYQLTNPDGEYDFDNAVANEVEFWGNGSVDSQVDNADVSAGDVLAVKRDGTYENDYGEFTNYEIRFKHFDP